MMLFLKNLVGAILFFLLSPNLFAKPIIDPDVLQAITSPTDTSTSTEASSSLSLIVFFNTSLQKNVFIKQMKHTPNVVIQNLGFMPAVALQIPKDSTLLNKIVSFETITQISSQKAAAKELDITAQVLKLTPSSFYPSVDNWWAHGYTGQKGIVGILDTGVDPTHPDLQGKKLVLRQEEGSGYSDYLNGVKEPHATGVACIYTGNHQKYKGMAYGTPTIISGLAGEETADTSSIMRTLSTLDWMLNRAELKPNLINYSMGNGPLSCPTCPEWSGLAKVIDYVVNTQKILWVKSAGNMGYIAPTEQFPFASTLTVPGDNYNGLTIANMNTIITEDGLSTKTADRTKHIIKQTSSRGPTPFGRRKPDLTAPGHDTRTCAPNPQQYGFNYSASMDYNDGYRLMGGTSSAAPHVGASALLMQDAGITNPIAIKALLINSADTWTDAGTPSTGHKKIMGSAWNRTYGWGYINMEKAFKQRERVLEGQLTVEKPIWEYQTVMKKGQKVTLVHERRVGYTKEGNEWKLSHLSLEIEDLDQQKIVDQDNSSIDTVHQVSNCHRKPEEGTCSPDDSTINVLIRVRLINNTVDGSMVEPFAIIVPRLNQATN